MKTLYLSEDELFPYYSISKEDEYGLDTKLEVPEDLYDQLFELQEQRDFFTDRLDSLISKILSDIKKKEYNLFEDRQLTILNKIPPNAICELDITDAILPPTKWSYLQDGEQTYVVAEVVTQEAEFGQTLKIKVIPSHIWDKATND